MKEISSYQPTKPPTSPKQQKKCRQLVLKIAQKFYFFHLFFSLIISIILIIIQPTLRSSITFTFALLIIYGFMLIWLALMNIIFVLINKQGCAVWCNRVIAKMTIMAYPILFLINILNQNFLSLPLVKTFMIYLLIVSILLIIYEIYSCTCGHHQQPSYLYQINDLDNHTDQVWRIRKDYYDHQKKNKSIVQI